MCENSIENSVASQMNFISKYLKVKIQEDNVTFQNHTKSRNHVYDLMKRSVVHGESHSAMIIGPRGCGKTTMINSVLHQLSKEVDLEKDAIIIKLNGLIHHDEKVALKSITAQMQLENAVDGKVFGTFAEQLCFLLSCLVCADRRARSMLFLLDECDLFCRAGRAQTLLYNLFDVTHSQQAPMCVLGITDRIDVMDLLEKRVKSRFSHRHMFIFPNEVDEEDQDPRAPSERCRGLVLQLLSLPGDRAAHRRGRRAAATHEQHTSVEVPEVPEVPAQASRRWDLEPALAALRPAVVAEWNARVRSLCDDDTVIDAIGKLCYYTANQQVLRNVLFQLVSKLKPSHPYIEATDVAATIDSTVSCDHRVRQLQSLSTLELSLVVAALHAAELLHNQPLNFEMVLHRYQKFAASNQSAQTVPRPVILKAFEHLQHLQLLVPARQHDQAGVHKEHRLHWVCAPPATVRAAVRGAKQLPTEIVHWLDNNIG